jgi:hypothetical protein
MIANPPWQNQPLVSRQTHLDSPNGIFRFLWNEHNLDETVAVQFVARTDSTDPSALVFTFTALDPDGQETILVFHSGHNYSITRSHARELWYFVVDFWDVVV